MSIRNLFFLSFMIIMTAACSSDVFLVHNGNMPADDKVALISKGQSREQVEEILGSPSSVTSFDGDTWIYMSSTLKKVAFLQPEIVDREVLAIKFNNQGKVVEISELDRKCGRDIAVDNTETPTEGHKIGFFRKYFGGVGAYMPIAPSGGTDGL